MVYNMVALQMLTMQMKEQTGGRICNTCFPPFIHQMDLGSDLMKMTANTLSKINVDSSVCIKGVVINYHHGGGVGVTTPIGGVWNL